MENALRITIAVSFIVSVLLRNTEHIYSRSQQGFLLHRHCNHYPFSPPFPIHSLFHTESIPKQHLFEIRINPIYNKLRIRYIICHSGAKDRRSLPSSLRILQIPTSISIPYKQ